MKNILVTGAAGFIGFHMCDRLLHAGHRVIGLDAMTDYYDVTLKERRLAILENQGDFQFVAMNLVDKEGLQELFRTSNFDVVIHLAAQAGVRYSIDEPQSYVDSNLIGGFNIIEACRHYPVEHLLFASTSSVYGANDKMPYAESDPTKLQMSFYAATKRANEAMAHSYAHLFDIPTTMFRFFTVYGPWGRPDMAPIKFTKKILAGEPIDIYNHGNQTRDFTYVTDIVEGIECLIDKKPPIGEFSPVAPYRVVNIGNAAPMALMDFIHTLEQKLGREAVKNYLPAQPGDVTDTWADTETLFQLTGFRAKIGLDEGLGLFVDWYLNNYNEA